MTLGTRHANSYDTDRIAATLAADIAAIQKRYAGNALGVIRMETLEQIASYQEHLQDRISGCTCGAAVPAFEIDVRKNNSELDFRFSLARMKRLAGEDARCVS